MKEILKYVILVSLIGLLQLFNSICLNRFLALYIWIAVNSIALLIFAHRFLYYRAIIGKYLGLNLRYLGEQYKPPFLVRSSIGKLLLTGKSDSWFTDVKALTMYKYLKILQALSGIFAGFALVAALILIVKYVK